MGQVNQELQAANTNGDIFCRGYDEYAASLMMHKGHYPYDWITS